MPTVAILSHMPGNTLGHLTQVLDGLKLDYRYLDLPTFDFTKPLPPLSGVVILGGEMSVNDATQYPFIEKEMGWISHWLENEKIPIFGICFGAQLLAKTLGATVIKNPVKEVGWYPITLTDAGKKDSVFGPLLFKNHDLNKLDQAPWMQFQWHQETYTLPQGAVHLASAPDCPQQVFRYGSKCYGVQFHPEMTASGVEAWLNESRSLSPKQKQHIWEETQNHLNKYQQQNQQLFKRFWEHCL
ncbi:MAG: type 1 glutamine amidotransferase [Cyanobacteria bacterium]|nr:type 1 glutamine amidotransferase [Cyanobacteriota bacterium]